MPGTEAEVWLFSAHIFLGYATVKADGTFEKVFDVPTGIDLGDHTIQAEGTARSGGDRAISAGVVISDDPKVAKRKPITKRVVIPFERNSAVLTPQSRALLKKYMAKNVTRVEVIGHVQQSGGMANDMSLSQARARQAAGFLTTPKRRVNTFVEGVGRRRSALPECIAVKNRCAVVSISYVPQAS
jgi:outer membrane protein OmpA-like peptidoglycan-associated protein